MGVRIMITICDAILSIKPGAEVMVEGTDINDCRIVWLNGTAEISKSDIEAKINELQADYDAKQYQRSRAKEYPKIGDQLDMLWHSIDESPELKQKYFKFYEAIKAVKAKYPK